MLAVRALKQWPYVNSSYALPATFETIIGDTTYAIDARPVHLAALGALVTLSLLVVAVLVALRKKSGAVITPLVPALATFFVAIPVFMYVTRRLVFSANADARWATVAFHDAILVDGAAAALGIGAAVAALLVLALRTEHHWPVLVFALPCAMLGLSLASAASHAKAIEAVGHMPYYEATGQRDMHVGRERDVAVRLVRPPRSRWLFGMENGPQPVDERTRSHWSAAERVHVRATAAGSVPFEAVAHNGPITLTTRLHARALPETASPLLSLRVGDRAVYRVRARSSDGAFLYFITLAGSDTAHEMAIEVVGTRERGGFRTFVIEVRRDDARRFVEVVALAGETRLYDAEDDTVGAPIVAFAGDVSSRPDPVPCSFALLGAPAAVCKRGGHDSDVPATAGTSPGAGASFPARGSRGRKRDEVGRPPVAFAGAAPAAFERNTSSTSGGIVTALVALATIGLVILPDGSSSSSYTLVSTHRGPEGAAEAPPG